jgi:peroxiredoxin family protein
MSNAMDMLRLEIMQAIQQQTVNAAAVSPQQQQMTILLASDDFDRVFLAFMLATSARSMGLEVNIFFALWGLNLLRREKHQPSMKNPNVVLPARKKSILSRMMAMMMPKGPARTGLSKMNFGGMGALMMRYFMKKSGAATLPQLMDMAVEAGVKFTICTLTMEIMGFSEDDILGLPNLQCAGVTSCLGDAVQSKLFFVV